MSTAPSPSRRLADRTFWVALLLSFVVLAGWALASPHMASPDEPAHAAKAAATVRGQLSADESQFRPGRGTFQVPHLFAQAWGQPCFAYEADVPAGCSPKIQGDLNAVVPVESHVARYNPLYYALVGYPTLLPLSELTFTAMRLVSALINATLIALTFRVLVGLRRPLLPMLGVFAALTPMTFFIGASITPQGPEVFGAILVGVALMSLVFDARPDALPARAWALAVGTAFFVLARGLSPGYLFLIVVLVVLAAPRIETVRDVLRDRRFWPPLAACIGLSVVALAYTLISGSLALGIVFSDPALTPRDVVVGMLMNTDDYLEQVLGVFGWADVHLPLVLLILIGGVALTVGILGLSLARWRGRLVLALILLASITVPIGVQLLSFRESGIVWQGRYVMPLAVQACLLAGFLAGSGDLTERVSAAVLKTTVAIAAVCQIAAIITNLHRYINGANGTWSGLVEDAWQPLVPSLAIVGAVAGAWVAAVLLTARFATRTRVIAEFSEPREPRMSGSSVG
jgi:hypothetical protein